MMIDSLPWYDILNHKLQITMIKIQNPKPVALSKERTLQCFGH
jgi:hypothetical protein